MASRGFAISHLRGHEISLTSAAENLGEHLGLTDLWLSGPREQCRCSGLRRCQQAGERSYVRHMPTFAFSCPSLRLTFAAHRAANWSRRPNDVGVSSVAIQKTAQQSNGGGIGACENGRPGAATAPKAAATMFTC